MKHTPFAVSPLTRAIALGLLFIPATTLAQETQEPSDAELEKIEVTGSLGSLPGQDVEAVFGFGKSILETPRSASTVSDEMMERFNVADIDELVAFAPGTFTQSFFGVAGSLDVRGTPGEAYFRGVKRLDNPGNYPTPIGASSRIDVVRGPASPIYGPAKVGGYLNFIPKSARSSRGQYLEEETGAFSYTTGSWDKSVLTAEVGGPGEIAGKQMGYYVYGEVENSGSYYDNSGTDQSVLQASFNVDISDNLRFELGGMYHNFEGNQVAGWNRLTQDLIDNGTYTTGQAQPLDIDGDGYISHDEFDEVDNGLFYWVATDPEDITPESLAGYESMALTNVGTTTISGSQVMVAKENQLTNEAVTLYFDTIYYTDSGWEIKNQLFYDAYDNMNENLYGFAQFHDSWVVEDKIVLSNEYEFDSLLASVQVSPSVRHVDFEHGDDFHDEYFDRMDLSVGATARDKVLLATQTGTGFDNYNVGNYTDYGLAALGDFTWDNGLSVLLGLRYDYLDMESSSKLELLNDPSGMLESASDTDGGVSWTSSISYKTQWGLIPYATASQQTTVVAGQGSELTAQSIADGTALSSSEMTEFGIKGSLLEDSLYFALGFFSQERTDYSSQNVVTNNTTKSEGTEFELRWVVTDQLVVNANYTQLEVFNLTAAQNGVQYGRIASADLPNIPGALIYGGVAEMMNTLENNPEAKKAGMPEHIYSLTATYDFQNGVAANVSVVDVDSTYSGFTRQVKLPGYTLVNAGVVYNHEDWTFSVNVKNLTDETYFRANFPDLFGNGIVLPELPRNYTAKVSYKF